MCQKCVSLLPIVTTIYGRCENIPSEESSPKKFVCSQCEEVVKKEGKTPPNKLQSTTFSATKQAINSGTFSMSTGVLH